jgi:hypothetical protein
LPQIARICFPIKSQIPSKQRIINTENNTLPNPCAVKSQTNNSSAVRVDSNIYHLDQLNVYPKTMFQNLQKPYNVEKTVNHPFTHVKARTKI